MNAACEAKPARECLLRHVAAKRTGRPAACLACDKAVNLVLAWAHAVAPVKPVDLPEQTPLAPAKLATAKKQPAKKLTLKSCAQRVIRSGFEHHNRLMALGLLAQEISRMRGMRLIRESVASFLRDQGATIGDASEHGFGCLVMDEAARRFANV